MDSSFAWKALDSHGNRRKQDNNTNMGDGRDRDSWKWQSQVQVYGKDLLHSIGAVLRERRDSPVKNIHVVSTLS